MNATTWKVFKSIRKPNPPQNKIERPAKGQGYRRKNRYGKSYEQED